MEQTQNTGRLETIPYGARLLISNFEKAVMERIVKYLSRRVRKSNRSHFCCFVLFLLAGRLCETA